MLIANTKNVREMKCVRRRESFRLVIQVILTLHPDMWLKGWGGGVASKLTRFSWLASPS